MTLGSLFDGSGTAPLSAEMLGINPLWASEIEPFPIRVTTKQFPKMKHYGDIGKMDGANIEPVDIITFGSPCQDLSVAGKRAGIQDGERSNLFFEAVRIIKEMRKATNGEYPKYAVWENVPGAFSSNKGRDFHAVLEAFCSVCDDAVSIPEPYDKKRTKLVWNKAGEVVGDNYSVAWRTLDAQYWGVPQRRKRIYLVADFTGRRAGEILFKPEGVSRNFTPGGTQRARTSPTSETSIDFANIAEGMMNEEQFEVSDSGINSTLVAKEPSGVAYGFPLGFRAENTNLYEELATTLCNGTRPGFCNGTVCQEFLRWIVRRLTPTECARLQGFPDWWCSNLGIKNPTEDDISFWSEVWETHRNIIGTSTKPKSRKQIIKWLQNPHSDAAEYKMWGNGMALPCVLYVLQGIKKVLK